MSPTGASKRPAQGRYCQHTPVISLGKRRVALTSIAALPERPLLGTAVPNLPVQRARSCRTRFAALASKFPMLLNATCIYQATSAGNLVCLSLWYKNKKNARTAGFERLHMSHRHRIQPRLNVFCSIILRDQKLSHPVIRRLLRQAWTAPRFSEFRPPSMPPWPWPHDRISRPRRPVAGQRPLDSCRGRPAAAFSYRTC